MRRRPAKNDPRCSFCGRSANQVDKIITGPSVHICNECVKLCNEVLAEEKKQTLPFFILRETVFVDRVMTNHRTQNGA